MSPEPSDRWTRQHFEAGSVGMRLTRFLSSSCQRAQEFVGTPSVCSAIQNACPRPWMWPALTRKEHVWCYPHASAADPQGWPTTIALWLLDRHPAHTAHTWARPACLTAIRGCDWGEVGMWPAWLEDSSSLSNLRCTRWCLVSDHRSGTMNNRAHWPPAFTVPDICHHCFIILIKCYHILI